VDISSKGLDAVCQPSLSNGTILLQEEKGISRPAMALLFIDDNSHITNA
jgi:hypothetical protein